MAATLDEIVVTARRVESKRSETPQKIEIISQQDIQCSVAQDLTDLLKKNSSVDVIQFNGMLSGLGIRGCFRAPRKSTLSCFAFVIHPKQNFPTVASTARQTTRVTSALNSDRQLPITSLSRFK